MAKPNVTLYGNISTNDAARTDASDPNYLQIVHGVGTSYDRLEFTDAGVNDGDPVGTYSTPIIPDSGTYTYPKAFIARYSQASPNNVMRYLPLLGGDYRYAFNIYFDGATAGIPYLEFYDDQNANSWAHQALGGDGTNPNPDNSYIKGVTTTNSAPAAGWAGTPLAGNADPNRLQLDTAALSGAKDLYCNLKVVIPAGVNAFSFADGYGVVRYAWQ